MNTEDTKIDKLTRDLMQGTAEQPSTSLMSRIMSAVMNEKEKARKGYVRKLPSIGGLMVGLVVYLFIAVGVFCLLIKNPGETEVLNKEFIRAFPIFLTFAAGASFFFLYSQLDKWLFQKEKQKAKK